jgi:squalene-associated FAD-dependent desaturase
MALAGAQACAGPDAGGQVLVVGGGLAGITAALDCAQSGARVTLVEVRRRLGGAAYSVQRGGLEMDNGQHVFLRCCVAYRGLLERIGSTPLVSLQERLEIPVLKPGAPRVLLRRGRLPAPLHLAPALLRYPYLSLRARVGAARAALALKALSEDALAGLDTQTLGGWLERRGQGARAQAALWDLIALPTLNLPASEASLALGAFVFREGVLKHADAGDIGLHGASLGATIARPALAALERAGVRVLLGWRAESLRAGTGGGFELQGRSGTAQAEGEHDQEANGRGRDEECEQGGEQGERDGLRAEAVVVALPHARAAGLLEPVLGASATAWRALESSPIVNLHLVYDREVTSERFAAGVDTPVQYLFDRTVAAGAPPGTQYLAVSLSGAQEEMSMSVDRLRERYVPALEQLLPRVRGARLESFLVTREHAATFRAGPGSAALRPPPETSLPGLALAGAWTATGWPATLEGAVLSGHAAAAEALRTLAGAGAGAQTTTAGDASAQAANGGDAGTQTAIGGDAGAGRATAVRAGGAR